MIKPIKPPMLILRTKKGNVFSYRTKKKLSLREKEELAKISTPVEERHEKATQAFKDQKYRSAIKLAQINTEIKKLLKDKERKLSVLKEKLKERDNLKDANLKAKQEDRLRIKKETKDLLEATKELRIRYMEIERRLRAYNFRKGIYK